MVAAGGVGVTTAVAMPIGETLIIQDFAGAM